MEKIAMAWNKIVNNSGVEDPEDLIVDLKLFDKMEGEMGDNVAADAMRATYANVPFDPSQTDTTPVQNQPEMPQMLADIPNLSQTKPEDFKATPINELLPSVDNNMMDSETDDNAVAAELRRRGVPETLIRQAIDAEHKGVSGEDILGALSEVMH